MEKVILITGYSSELGKYIAEDLADKGYKVYAGIHNKQERIGLGRIWNTRHSNITLIPLDITSDENCSLVVKTIIDKEKHIDILINAAGITYVGLAITFTSSEFMNILNINVIGAFRLSKAILPYMIKQNSGKIINVTSLIGVVAIPNLGMYCASKFALEGLGQSLRYEVVWITNIAPAGMTDKKKIYPQTRVKFARLKKLIMPLYDYSVISNKVDWIIQTKKPPPRVVIGIYAKFISLFHSFLQNNVSDYALRYIGSK